MISTRSLHAIRAAAVAVAVLAAPALAAVDSSCAPPCTVAPKSALFVRENDGTINANSYIVPLQGTLQKGTRKTVLRVDVSLFVQIDPSMPSVYIYPTVNGQKAGTGYAGLMQAVCDHSLSAYCSVSGSFWWDLDALEAAHPGKFIGQPLNIAVDGGSLVGGGVGQPYSASFSAELVKKK